MRNKKRNLKAIALASSACLIIASGCGATTNTESSVTTSDSTMSSSQTVSSSLPASDDGFFAGDMEDSDSEAQNTVILDLPQIEPVEVYNNNDIVVTFNGFEAIEPDPQFSKASFYCNFEVKNNHGSSVEVDIVPVVNGYTFGCGYFYADQSEVVSSKVHVGITELELADITENINNIAFQFTVLEKDETSHTEVLEICSYTVFGEENYEASFPEDAGTVVIDEIMYQLNAKLVTDSKGECHTVLYLKNKSTMPMEIRLNDVKFDLEMEDVGTVLDAFYGADNAKSSGFSVPGTIVRLDLPMRGSLMFGDQIPPMSNNKILETNVLRAILSMSDDYGPLMDKPFEVSF